MRAITLHQPWASLIAGGIKTIETRSWHPPTWLIGQRIAVHAGKKLESVHRLDPRLVNKLEELYSWWQADLPSGAVVCTAVLTKVCWVSEALDSGMVKVADWPRDTFLNQYSEIPPDPYGDFAVGRWLWFLDAVQQLVPPIPATGRQGFWHWEAPPSLTYLATSR